MNLGTPLVWAALAGSLASFGCYVAATAGRNNLREPARHLYTAATATVIAISVLLLTFMLTDRFDIRYVHDYSSRAQPLLFKISGFWGGQEGSWLLWLTWISVVGLVLARRAGDWEAPAMAFWASVQVFFLTVLVQRGPFVLTGTPTQDGMGLNPLLQNYWMAIHPPILFLGFTLISVPAAFAFAALLRNSYTDWTRLASGWAVLGWTALGAGVLLGGFWAYETLGWGGWWGWDPVENASLVPWLLGGALVHGLMLERRKGGWQRMNLALAFGCFILVIYATFLTRSGVLGDFSVHSFAALGNSYVLVGFLAAYTLLAVGMLAWRSRSQGPEPAAISGKEFLVFLGIVMFGLAGVLVAIGMSSPLLSKAFAGQAGNVPIEYYYRVSAPIGLVMLALAGLSPLWSWARSGSSSTLFNRSWRMLVGLSLLVGLVLGLVLWAQRGPEQAARFTIAWYAVTMLIPNLWVLFDGVRRLGFVKSGGHVAHVGLAIFFIGMLASSHNNKAVPDRLTLVTDASQEHLGMQWTLKGIGETTPEGKEPFEIEVRDAEGRTFMATPVMQRVREGMMRHPYIRKSLLGDLYIAPVEQDVANPPPHTTLPTGGKAKLGPYNVEFLGFTGMQTLADGSIQAGARLKVEPESGKAPAQEVISVLKMTPQGARFFPAPLQGTEDQILITQMSVEDGAASILLDGPKWRENMGLMGTIEVTFKPFVWVLWLGAITIAVGGGLSTVRRMREARQRSISPEMEQIGEEAASDDTPAPEHTGAAGAAEAAEAARA